MWNRAKVLGSKSGQLYKSWSEYQEASGSA